MREGEVVRARLVAVHSYGLAIEAEGMPGFVQPVELSWDPNATPADVGEIGEELDVLVYAITPERFYGSLKQARADLDPWRDPERFRVGSIHRGEVTGIVDWGMAVAIAPGVTGMVVAPRLAEAFEVGSRVDVEVVLCDPALRKLELAIQRTFAPSARP